MRPLKQGDAVRIRAESNPDEFDVGEVRSVRGDRVRVYWHVAREAHVECADDLERCVDGDCFAYFPSHDGYVCDPCVQRLGLDYGPVEVECWDVGSEGWTGPIDCEVCKLPIPVIVDGSDD